VGNRLYHWLLEPKTKKEITIRENLNDNDSIFIITLKKHWYMANSLETYLLDKFETEFNERI